MTRLTIRSQTLIVAACILAEAFLLAPVAQARSLKSLLPLIGSAHAATAASSSATATPAIGSQTGTAPAANVYDASDAIPAGETSTLLALAAAMALVGGLILQERWLYALLDHISPRRAARKPQRDEQTTFRMSRTNVAR